MGLEQRHVGMNVRTPWGVGVLRRLDEYPECLVGIDGAICLMHQDDCEVIAQDRRSEVIDEVEAMVNELVSRGYDEGHKTIIAIRGLMSTLRTGASRGDLMQLAALALVAAGLPRGPGDVEEQT